MGSKLISKEVLANHDFEALENKVKTTLSLINKLKK
jgi:2-dehydro-3-deoxyphosphogluconate aldolase/(4S)-4-hydroxy-2-oxoglutarate aldolase